MVALDLAPKTDKASWDALGRDRRRFYYVVWRDLGVSPTEFEELPWWEQDIITEGIQEDYHRDPDRDPDTGDPDTVDSEDGARPGTAAYEHELNNPRTAAKGKAPGTNTSTNTSSPTKPASIEHLRSLGIRARTVPGTVPGVKK